MKQRPCLVNISMADAPAEWRGSWIFHETNCRPKNVFYAKRVFDLAALPGRALVHVAADSRYALFCNGVLIGRGPVRGTHEVHFFDTYDLRPYLTGGQNVLAVAVHVIGRPTYVYVPGTPGWLVEDGGAGMPISTGEEWRVRAAPGYDEAATQFTFQAGWTELYDARKEVPDWAGPSLDGWEAPAILSVGKALEGRRLRPRMIPAIEDEARRAQAVPQWNLVPPCDDAASLADYGMLMETEPHLTATPDTLEAVEEFLKGEAALTVHPPPNGEGVQLLLDLGQTIAGHLEFEVEGPEGALMDIAYNEALVKDRLPAARGELDGREYRFADRYVLRDGVSSHRHLFAFRAGRFVQLVFRDFSSPIRLHRLELHRATYPVNPRGRFSCDDLVLSRLYEAGRYTLELCMWDTYMDCPWREQAMWIGDMFTEMLFEHLSFGDGRLSRQCIEMAAHGLTECGLLRSVYPSEADRIIPSFSLLWVLSVENYVRYTGDRGVLDVVFEAVTRVLEAFEGQRAESGLLEDFEGLWQFYDWGYRKVDGQCGLQALLYLGALRAAASMADRLERCDAAATWREQATQTADAVNRLLWDPSANAYRDAFLPEQGVVGHVSQQTNGLAAFFGIVPPDRLKGVLDVLERDDDQVVKSEPFYLYFVLTALARHGRQEKAVGMLRDLYEPMLASETGTIWEYWRGKERCASLCHAFSCVMLSLLPESVMGIEPVDDGFDTFRCAPHPAGLSFAQGRVPTPHGAVEVSWLDSPEQFGLSLSVPYSETACQLFLPVTGRSVSVKNAAGKEFPYTDQGVRLGPGKYTCVVKK